MNALLLLEAFAISTEPGRIVWVVALKSFLWSREFDDAGGQNVRAVGISGSGDLHL